MFSKKAITNFLFIFLMGLLFSAAKPVQNGNLQLLVFQGSDWCAKCIRFEQNILSDSIFKAYAKTNQVLLERIDFPQRKKLDSAVLSYNERIAEKYNFQGEFPTVLLVNTQNSSFVRLYPKRNQTAQDFIEIIQKKRSEIE